MSTGNSIKYGTENPKNTIYKYLDESFKLLNDVQFLNNDFRILFRSIQIREIYETFIYCDAPYIETNDNYSNSFTKQDSIDLFNCLQETGCKWAMSEFDNEFIINQAKERNLNIIIIGERRNLKNHRTEILITNYQNQQLKLF